MAFTDLVKKSLFAISVLFFFNFEASSAQVQHVVRLPNGSYPLNAGICQLEVPTIDLLSDQDKHGVVPTGNGSRPGFSKIQICCSGWKRQPHSAYHCEPDCDNGCVNGNCTAPNVCICLPGYIHDLDHNCVPKCPKGCLNGICTNQGQCSCNSGYRVDPKGEFCAPYCSGGCGSGGNCTAPEVCSCKAGLVKDVKSGKCGYHCEGGCGTGECVGPNQCSCAPGFIKRGNACEALCPRGCVNGDCTGPNRCVCKPGWTMDPTGTSCQAHCTDPCFNGDCTGPNVCTCKQGYIKDPALPMGNRCVAHCPAGCPNGTCSAPNFCICNMGFIKRSNVCVTRTRRSALHFDLLPEQNN